MTTIKWRKRWHNRKVTPITVTRLPQGVLIVCFVEGNGYVVDVWPEWDERKALSQAIKAYRTRYGHRVIVDHGTY